jgi:uncharacterized membrane protein (DUF2068 family)
MSANKGLRAIALFEAAKGLLVLLAGLGALGLLHRDLEDVAHNLLQLLRLNPSARYPQIFLEKVSHVTHGQLWWTAYGAAVYSTFRLAEAYGLWYERTWAEWLAVVSGLLPLQFEIVGLFRHPTMFRTCLLLLNILVVFYVAAVMVLSRQRAARLKLKVVPEC